MMKLRLLAKCTAFLAIVGCSKSRATDSRSIPNAPTVASAAVPVASSRSQSDVSEPMNPPVHIHRPNDTYHLPSPVWNEQMDRDQILSSWGDWATRYAGELFGKVQTGTWVTDVRAFMEFFNAPQMEWFIDTPNVKSYEQQMEIRARFLKNRTKYHLEIAGPGWKVPVKWDERGTTAHFTLQTENWLEPIPAGWSKCQFPQPYSDHILNNEMGQPVVWVLTDRDLMFHVNRKGQVDSFRIVPIGMTRYSVKKVAKCWLDPGGSDAKADPFVLFTPAMSAPSNGHEVGCPSGMLAGVVLNGTPCYLDYAVVKKAQKQDYSPPKSWQGYSESVILPAQPAP